MRHTSHPVRRPAQPSSLSAKCWLRLIQNIRESTRLLQRFPLSQQHYTDVTIIPMTTRKPGGQKAAELPKDTEPRRAAKPGVKFPCLGDSPPLCSAALLIIIQDIHWEGEGRKEREKGNIITLLVKTTWGRGAPRKKKTAQLGDL